MTSAPPVPPAQYRDLHALYINCTLQPSPQLSHTGLLMEASQAIMRAQGVSVDTFRAVDYQLAPGMQPDMRDHGFDEDDWPELFRKVMAADILVLGTPIWLGTRSSVCSRVIERLYAHSGETNDRGQYLYYGKVGGCLVTGNEDGIKHVARGVLYSLQHIGYLIPPQADAGWIGEVGPGPSYGDDGPHGKIGYDSDFTQRMVTFMTWNLLHLARLMKDAGGIPAYGNQLDAWQAGQRFGFPAEFTAAAP
jgi:multimeric flavodoxin WrbA